ncbi:hypothetical protein [Actinomycetospora termitidis]|uniref:Uncharacterized protein n=1 Tax=Actinomycetospora termitidis TaxID=3053470 RepID=A0ABT7M2U9_9PSEU|nr:hypothetical protein [Actinomycetospora sp. Odt1-22]MDL5154981.1 hypothetical protein [Actinomycetospora sp. Odt1-22]
MDPDLARNPAALPDSTPEKQSELKLNVGIGVLGTLLSLFCAVIFFTPVDEIILAIVFLVVTVISAVVTLRFYGRLKKARSSS